VGRCPACLDPAREGGAVTGTRGVPGDDPWEGVVFDEAFVKAGRHEPSARTRESIARYGGQRTSWRQGALLEPVPARRRRTRRPRRHWQLVAAVVGVAALAWFSIARTSPAPEIPDIAAPPPGPAIIDPSTTHTVSPAPSTQPQPPAVGAAAGPAGAAQPHQPTGPATATSTTDVSGVSEFDAVGTCYLDPLTGEENIQLDPVDCTAAHNLELVSHRTAANDAAEYPDPRYWQQVVGAACQDDLSAYLGTPDSAWPTGLNPSWLIPKPESWAFGNRHVYCMARSDQTVTTSVLDRTAHA
jgi:hypothetical protein